MEGSRSLFLLSYSCYESRKKEQMSGLIMITWAPAQSPSCSAREAPGHTPPGECSAAKPWSQFCRPAVHGSDTPQIIAQLTFSLFSTTQPLGAQISLGIFSQAVSGFVFLTFLVTSSHFCTGHSSHSSPMLTTFSSPSS